MITPEQIQRWREAFEKATPGPYDKGKDGQSVITHRETNWIDQDAMLYYGGEVICETIGPSMQDFLIGAHEALPLLLDEVDRFIPKPIESAPKDRTSILAFGYPAGEIHGPQDCPIWTTIFWNGGRTDYPGYDWVVDGSDAYAVWFKPLYWIVPPNCGGKGVENAIS